MLRVIAIAASYNLPAHLKKETGRINPNGADSRAEPTEAAFEGHPLVLFTSRVVSISDLLGLAVFPKKGALFLAKVTLNACGRNRFDFFVYIHVVYKFDEFFIP